MLRNPNSHIRKLNKEFSDYTPVLTSAQRDQAFWLLDVISAAAASEDPASTLHLAISKSGMPLGQTIKRVRAFLQTGSIFGLVGIDGRKSRKHRQLTRKLAEL